MRVGPIRRGPYNMKRSAEGALFTTFPIEGELAGTSFVVNHRWSEERPDLGYFLVTNRHIVGKSKTGRVTLTLVGDDDSRNPHRFEVPYEVWSLWRPHPDEEASCPGTAEGVWLGGCRRHDAPGRQPAVPGGAGASSGSWETATGRARVRCRAGGVSARCGRSRPAGAWAVPPGRSRPRGPSRASGSGAHGSSARNRDQYRVITLVSQELV